MKDKIYIANWKMNITSKEAQSFFDKFERLYKKEENKKVVLCPSFTTLVSSANSQSLKNLDNIYFGAQNVSDKISGAFTGEVSAAMLEEIEVEYCIVGHSERRAIYNETDQMINDKIKLLAKSGIIPILCVGETLDSRERGESDQVVLKQLSSCLNQVAVSEIIIAYEPVWAIGTGKNASISDISNMNSTIKKQMNKLGYIDDQFYILYGGSVDIDNLSSIDEASFLNGFLIGGASLNPQNFWDIIDK